jgi:hypothetical protein
LCDKVNEKVIAKLRSIEGWLEEINYNIGVNKGCPLSPTLFGIYIDKLEACLEETICVGISWNRSSLFFTQTILFL